MPEYDDEPNYNIPSPYRLIQDSVMKQWLDSEGALEKIEYILKGYKKDFETGEWVYQKGEEWMNNTGVNKVIGSIMSFLDTTLTLSDLENQDINDLAYAYRIKLIKLLAMQYDKFNLDLQSYGSTIVNNCSSLIFFALRRARKFQTAKALQPNTTLLEQKIEKKEPEEKKGGILSMIPLPKLRR